MKRLNNLYNNICDIDRILKMTERVLSKTTNKKKVDNFENYKMEHIINIKTRLINKNYSFSRYSIFMITDPKHRIIMDMELEDKIINHLISKYILIPVFGNRFTNSMVATRIGKGTSYGIKLLKKYLNKLKNDNFYVLKIDIKKYFYSIDHNVLKRILRDNIKDKDSLNILNKIIDLTDFDYVNKRIIDLKKKMIDLTNNKNIINKINEIPLYEKGKGCSIGNQTSQNFGLIYLTEFNHFLKEKLRLKYVINYMDDFVILHRDKKYLNYCLKEIEKELKKYKLELNIRKTRVDSIKSGIDFLGYRFYIINKKIIMKLRKRNIKSFRSKVKKIKLLREKELINDLEYINMLSSYKGLLKYNIKLYYRCVYD